MLTSAATLALLASLTAGPEAAAPPPWTSFLDVHGYVDAYYAHNFNRPADGSNFISGTGTSAKRAGEAGLNLAALDVALKPQPVGFRLILNAGTGTEVVHAYETIAPATSPAAWRFVQQASVIWEPTAKLHVEGGIYPSHIGFEYLPSKDNWTYTRANMSELGPYYQAGVMAKYAFTDQFSAQLHLINGWQAIGDNNRAKTIGAQLAWNSDLFSVAFNTCIGPELAGNDQDWRFFGDLVALWKPTSKLSLAAVVDAALQQQSGAAPATWQAAGLFGRYAFTDVVAVAARAELVLDRDGAISGTAQQLWEGTATLEVKPAAALTVKLEGRYDQSSAAAFSASTVDVNGDPDLVNSQFVLALGAVAGF